MRVQHLNCNRRCIKDIPGLVIDFHLMIKLTIIAHNITLIIQHGPFIAFKRQTVRVPITRIRCQKHFVTVVELSSCWHPGMKI